MILVAIFLLWKAYLEKWIILVLIELRIYGLKDLLLAERTFIKS